jgi:hypothetical protein
VHCTPSFKIQELKPSTLIATAYEGAAVPPTSFNAPDDNE